MTESTGHTEPLLVCAPLRFEARAVRRGLRDSARAAGSGRRAARRGAPEVLRAGYGPAGACRSGGTLPGNENRWVRQMKLQESW